MGTLQELFDEFADVQINSKEHLSQHVAPNSDSENPRHEVPTEVDCKHDSTSTTKRECKKIVDVSVKSDCNYSKKYSYHQNNEIWRSSVNSDRTASTAATITNNECRNYSVQSFCLDSEDESRNSENRKSSVYTAQTWNSGVYTIPDCEVCHTNPSEIIRMNGSTTSSTCVNRESMDLGNLDPDEGMRCSRNSELIRENFETPLVRDSTGKNGEKSTDKTDINDRASIHRTALSLAIAAAEQYDAEQEANKSQAIANNCHNILPNVNSPSNTKNSNTSSKPASVPTLPVEKAFWIFTPDDSSNSPDNSPNDEKRSLFSSDATLSFAGSPIDAYGKSPKNIEKSRNSSGPASVLWDGLSRIQAELNSLRLSAMKMNSSTGINSTEALLNKTHVEENSNDTNSNATLSPNDDIARLLTYNIRDTVRSDGVSSPRVDKIIEEQIDEFRKSHPQAPTPMELQDLTDEQKFDRNMHYLSKKLKNGGSLNSNSPLHSGIVTPQVPTYFKSGNSFKPENFNIASPQDEASNLASVKSPYYQSRGFSVTTEEDEDGKRRFSEENNLRCMKNNQQNFPIVIQQASEIIESISEINAEIKRKSKARKIKNKSRLHHSSLPALWRDYFLFRFFVLLFAIFFTIFGGYVLYIGCEKAVISVGSRANDLMLFLQKKAGSGRHLSGVEGNIGSILQV